MIEKYKNLIIKISNDINDQDVYKLVDYFNTNDFYTAPASTKHHQSYECGLCEHCIQVFNYINKLSNIMAPGITNKDMFLLAFGHDLAKINYYVKEEKWKKVNGKWESYIGYMIKTDPTSLYHEAESVVRLFKVVDNIDIKITQAILYHHGAFNEGTKYSFSDNCTFNDYTLLLHTADMLSSSRGDNEKI